MASTLTTYASLLKRRYTTDKVENLALSESPFLAEVPKDTNGVGDGENVPLIHANPQGISTTVANAQTATSNVKAKHFVLTYGDYYGSVDIGDKVLSASRSNLGAFLDNKTAEIDGLISQMGNDLATFAFGNGGLALGKRASASTNVITLSSVYDVSNFEEGMYVQASSADGSGGSDALRAGNTYVTLCNRVDGKITLNDASAITSFADNDYLFRLGVFAGNTTNYIMAGLGAFIASGETPAALYSMTRTSDPVRLAGCRLTATDIAGKGTMERLKLLGATMAGRYRSAKFDRCYMNPEDWEALEISLMAHGMRSLTDPDTKFGFKMIEATLGGRAVKVFADPHCPKGNAFLVSINHWKLKSMEELIKPFDKDGLTIVRKATAADYEFRARSYPALVTNAPLYNGRVSV